MTGVINKLVTRSQCTATGFIAGFFFSGDLDPAFASQFNHGEIFYSIVADPGSTLSCAHSATEVKQLTPVTFTHEFQHMISYVQHVLVRGGHSEEGWLRYTTWHFRTTYGSLHSQNPTNFPLAYPLVPSVSGGDGVSVSGVLRSGSGVYQRALQGAGAPGFALLFSASGGAPLPLAIEPRLTIIRIR